MKHYFAIFTALFVFVQNFAIAASVTKKNQQRKTMLTAEVRERGGGATLSDGRRINFKPIKMLDGTTSYYSFAPAVQDPTIDNIDLKDLKSLMRYMGQQQDKQNSLMNYQKELAKEDVFKKTKVDIINESTKKLPVDSATFFIAIGGVITLQMLNDHGGNALAMQRHFDSLKDPMSHLSFYSFILANGLTSNAVQKMGYEKLDAAAQQRLFKYLPYIGMSAGSLASNLVGDIGHLLKSCAADLLSESARKKHDTEKTKEGLTFTSCEEAYRLWTVPEMATKYAPIIFSLFSSNYLSEKIHAGMNKAGRSTNGFLIEKIGFDLGASRAGRFALKGIQIFGNPFIFMATDMLITSPFSQKIFGTNLTSSAMNTVKSNFQELLSACAKSSAAKENVDYAIPVADAMGAPLSTNNIQNPDEVTKECEKFGELLIQWKDQNTKWRSLLNEEFEVAFQDWSELFPHIINQEAAAKKFYETLILNISLNRISEKILADNKCLSLEDFQNEIKNSNNKVNFPEQCAKGYAMKTMVPNLIQRPYPLYGVIPESELFGADKIEQKEVIKKTFDAQQEQVNQIEKAQMIKIIKATLLFNRILIQKMEFDQNTAQKLSSITEKLLSQNIKKTGEGLAELNSYIKEISKAGMNQTNKQLYTLLYNFRSELGNPYPILNEFAAFPYVYAMNSSNKDYMDATKYRFESKRYPYFFEKTSDYFIHEIICGSSEAQFTHSMKAGSIIWNKSYAPARLIKQEGTSSFCSPQLVADQSNYVLNYNKKITYPNGEKYNSPLEYIYKNLSDDFIDENNSKFANWWLKVSEPLMKEFVKESDQVWSKVFKNLISSFKGESFIQDWRLTDGFFTAKMWNHFVYSMSEQPRNPMDALKLEYYYYSRALAGMDFMINEKSKSELRSFEQKKNALFNFQKSVNDSINYLQSLFNDQLTQNGKHYRDNYYPDREKIRQLRMNLIDATNNIHATYVKSEANQNKKYISERIFYGLNSISQELQRYMMASYLTEMNSVEDANDMKMLMNNQMKNNSRQTANPFGGH